MPPREPVIPLTLFFVTAMMSIFSVVIAFFKDIPDVKGDRMSSINTLSVRFGVRVHTSRAPLQRATSAKHHFCHLSVGAHNSEPVHRLAVGRICWVSGGTAVPMVDYYSPHAS